MVHKKTKGIEKFTNKSTWEPPVKEDGIVTELDDLLNCIAVVSTPNNEGSSNQLNQHRVNRYISDIQIYNVLRTVCPRYNAVVRVHDIIARYK